MVYTKLLISLYFMFILDVFCVNCTEFCLSALYLKPTGRSDSLHKVMASPNKSLLPQNYFNHFICYMFWLTRLHPSNKNLYFSTVSPTSVIPTNQISLYSSQFPNTLPPLIRVMPQRLKLLNNNKLESSIPSEVPNNMRNREGSFIFLPLLVEIPFHLIHCPSGL